MPVESVVRYVQIASNLDPDRIGEKVVNRLIEDVQQIDNPNFAALANAIQGAELQDIFFPFLEKADPVI